MEKVFLTIQALQKRWRYRGQNTLYFCVM